MEIEGSPITFEVPYQIIATNGSDAELDITTNQLPAGEVNQPYSTNIASIGGVGTKTFKLIAESDQTEGLSLSQDGTITWAPAGLYFGYYNLIVKVKDQENTEVVKNLSLYMKGSLTIYPSTTQNLKQLWEKPSKHN